MPTPECWEELGALRAEVDIYSKQYNCDTQRIDMLERRIEGLEHDRIRIKTAGALAAFALTGVGVLFGDVIRKGIATVFR
jgi:hypothetical protein